MDRNFDRETYLNKEKYDEAVKKENEEKEKLISQRVEDMQREMDYVERQWRYLRKCIA